jgi:RimJ/RimL family protein N-acetyltransferase
MGRAGLDFAFDVVGVQAVVSCTVRHNARSRAVMERIGMPYAGILAGLDDGDDLVVHVLLRSAR